ncbi:MAG: hypothetical protein ABS79_00485 [Planctomycetes bacterium SCN 63-9]|nr:MAG: hypothetical protein ABS79_00485 [Planctomycetes bacterium SCN 63-9]
MSLFISSDGVVAGFPRGAVAAGVEVDCAVECIPGYDEVAAGVGWRWGPDSREARPPVLANLAADLEAAVADNLVVKKGGRFSHLRLDWG